MYSCQTQSCRYWPGGQRKSHIMHVSYDEGVFISVERCSVQHWCWMVFQKPYSNNRLSLNQAKKHRWKRQKSSWSVWTWLNNFLYFIAGFISGLTGHSSVSRAFLLAVDRSLWSRWQRKLLEAGLLPVTLFVYENTDRNNPRRLWFLFRFSDVIFSATNFETFGHQEYL